MILLAVSKSLERTANIARANQVFFMTESGIEAAFYHHNARGAGVDFVRDGNGDVDDSQKISHGAVGGTVEWEIKGRDNPIIGLLKENQTVQIPFFWDSSLNPAETVPDPLTSIDNFRLTFDESGTLSDYNFQDQDTSNDEHLIDWKITRKNIDKKVQTFLPIGSSITKSGAILESAVSGMIINSSATISGRITPCLESADTGGCPVVLSKFFSGDDNFVGVGGGGISELQLIFRPLLSFTNNAGAKISGIPFSVDSDNDIPKSSYDIVASVELGNFNQKQELTIPEKTAIGSFNYVIFD